MYNFTQKQIDVAYVPYQKGQQNFNGKSGAEYVYKHFTTFCGYFKYTHTHCLSALALAFDIKNECLHMKLQTTSISLHSCSTKTSMIHREMSLCASALKLFPGHFGYPQVIKKGLAAGFENFLENGLTLLGRQLTYLRKLMNHMIF